jgi:protein gp37
MSEFTSIEWTDHTFNPWWGCVKVSAGCDNCYANTLADRYGHGVWGAKSPRRFLSDSNWDQPLKWNKAAAKTGVRKRVFCASMADVFESRPDLIEPRARLFELIAATPNLDWQLLTKRPQNIKKLLPKNYVFPPNLWLGTTVENQDAADKRIRYLMDFKDAAVLFLSCEPLLGAVDITKYLVPDMHGTKIGWVIVGGEAGHGARAMNPLWAESLLTQCEASGTPVLFKQWGDYLPEARFVSTEARGRRVAVFRADGTEIPMVRVGKKKAGRLFRQREWNGFPEGGTVSV